MGRQSREAEERRYFTRCIEKMEKDLEEDGTFTKEIPRPKIVKHPDLLEKLWGWDRLVPMGDVSWSEYKTYTEEYHCRNVDAVSSIAALARACLKSEELILSELKIQMKSENLPVRKLIVLSCLIHKRVCSFIRAGCSSSHPSREALLCIAKEADLTCQLLRCGADPDDDYFIDQCREIRMCALSLMNCTSDNSVAASAVMLGMAKEAEMVHAWMSENKEPVDFSDDLVPDEIGYSHRIRYRTFDVMIYILEESSAAASAAAGHKSDEEGPAIRNGHGADGNVITADGSNVMINILEESSSAAAGNNSDKEEPASRNGPGADGICITAGANVMINILEESSAAAAGHKSDKEGPASRNGPRADGNGITADGAANTLGIHCIIDRGGISDVLDSHYKKNIDGGEKSMKRKLEKDPLEKLWGWETLLPLSRSVDWADYCSYLEKYYKRNVSEFVSSAPANLQIVNNALGAAIAKSCLKMEEELLSKWKARNLVETLPVSTIIQSSLIKELVLPICLTGGELFASSEVAFLCITKEADLMCELLNHGAKPFDDIINQSNVVRMCALGLANLEGQQSIYAAAVMVGMANEAKKMCDWIRREKKPVTFSLSEPDDLVLCHLIRIKALDVMTSILQDSTFPCSKMRDDDAMASD